MNDLNSVATGPAASLPRLRHHQTRWGLLLLGVVTAAGLLAPWLTPADPTAIHLEEALLPPSGNHWLGTDQLGRDVASRLLYGARVSLSVGLVAVGIATLVGIAVGAAAGYAGGWVDAAAMRFADIMFCFPTLFLILAVVAFLAPSLLNIMIVIGLTNWMGIARLMRAEVLSLKSREFILAARLAGASPAWIIRAHLLPNALAPIVVNITFGMAGAILIESGLSFLGLGIQPPTPSWGNMLAEGKATLGVAWWLTLAPGAALLAVTLGCHLVGEGLRAAGGRRP
ncbi:MAG: ABC transporter permease [Candidatus Omnitrophica bacterium]|nr:ABC transporter permease [Candidatus Omnitrophota bacterium]